MTGTRIEKLLIANRGEIARRVMRTCRTMGIHTVAVFSDADADAPFVREADEAVRVGPAPSTESYLSIEAVVDAAKRTGADAVHPGYGFLAENADFAQACADAGLRFVGPTADAIRSMGSKQRAKAIVSEAGVPVIPGYDGADQSTDVLAAEAEKVGFPVLLKASAGGGGKGMRIVRDASELREGLESARREAENAFGDGTMLVERYIDRPRHVEIQILGDTHGNLIHLFERECSIQRRHQKIVEESPSPALTDAKRAQMGEAAVKVGKAIGYENAGTVEFILAPDGAFYFLEVNTRLQVEHPVTECVTGLDLVHEQIRVTQGEELGYGQSDVRIEGAAVEVRLYAEDPANGFLPASGQLVDWEVATADGVRVDDGVESGSEVSIHYDPMLAKVISWGPSRGEALRKLVRALRASSVQGVKTNREFLVALLSHPAFVAGEIDTHFIERHGEALLAAAAPSGDVTRRAAVAAALAGQEARRCAMPGPRVGSGFRFAHFSDQWVELEGEGGTTRVEYRHLGGGRFRVRVAHAESELTVVRWDPPSLVLEEDGVRRALRVMRAGDRWYVHGLDGAVAFLEKPRFPVHEGDEVSGGQIAPMPGKIVDVRVAPGTDVGEGDVLLVMEAMKMEHTVRAPHAGTVSAVHVAAGDQVDADQLLVVVDAAE